MAMMAPCTRPKFYSIPSTGFELGSNPKMGLNCGPVFDIIKGHLQNPSNWKKKKKEFVFYIVAFKEYFLAPPMIMRVPT